MKGELTLEVYMKYIQCDICAVSITIALGERAY